MRILSEGEWICHHPWVHGEAKRPLRVVSLGGKVLLEINDSDVVWPDEDRQLYLCDVLDLMGINPYNHCLFDFVGPQSAHNEEGSLLDDADKVYFGKVYTLLQRRCARCSICQACCTRVGAHILCCHGSFEHLWRRPKPNHQRFQAMVEGYYNGCGLKSSFSRKDIVRELCLIGQQYDITIPDGFLIV